MIGSFRNEYNFLSNFYEAPVKINNITYKNNEAAFQAQKSMDNNVRMMFSQMNGSDAKKMGRRVSLRADWNIVRYNIMLEICREKFKQNPYLAEKLIATGDEELVENNTWGDVTWGKVNGEGKNWLGKILMTVRKELRD